MTTPFAPFITNFQEHLSNADYLHNAIINGAGGDASKTVTIRINDVSHQLASGYGTWKVLLTLEIDGTKKVYTHTHHNESWYLSQKTVYDPSRADSDEELKEAYEAFQAAFEAVVDANINDIIETCLKAAEDEE